MSLMDTIKEKTGSLLHTDAMGGNKIFSAVSDLIQQQGGINGLVASFQNKGYGDVVKSWIGTGTNQEISTSQLTEVFGADKIASVASKHGVDANDLTSKLSTYLPKVIDKLTPDGQVSSSNFSMDKIMKLGTDFFKGRSTAENEPPRVQ